MDEIKKKHKAHSSRLAFQAHPGWVSVSFKAGILTWDSTSGPSRLNDSGFRKESLIPYSGGSAPDSNRFPEYLERNPLKGGG